MKQGYTWPPSVGFRPPVGEEGNWVLTKEPGVARWKEESIQLRPRQLQKQLSEEATGLRQSLAWLRGGEAMPVKLKRSQAKKK